MLTCSPAHRLCPVFYADFPLNIGDLRSPLLPVSHVSSDRYVYSVRKLKGCSCDESPLLIFKNSKSIPKSTSFLQCFSFNQTQSLKWVLRRLPKVLYRGKFSCTILVQQQLHLCPQYLTIVVKNVCPAYGYRMAKFNTPFKHVRFVIFSQFSGTPFNGFG